MALLRICTIASSATRRASSAMAPPSSEDAIASELMFCPIMYSIALSTTAPAWLSSAGGGSSELGAVGIVVSLDLFGGFRWGFRRRFGLILLLGLDFPHVGIQPAARQQRGVGAALGHAALVQHHVLVGVDHGRQAVRDHQRGAMAR